MAKRLVVSLKKLFVIEKRPVVEVSIKQPHLLVHGNYLDLALAKVKLILVFASVTGDCFG